MYSGDIEIKGKFTLIVAAAGSGKRMNLDVPKQYLQLDSYPLYFHSVLIGERSRLVEEIVIVAPKGDQELIKKECKDYGIKKRLIVVSGGSERQDSIMRGLEVATAEFVAIQDGARPFIKEHYLEESYKTLQSREMNIDGTVIGVKAKDTVKIIDSEGFVVDTPRRENLILAQTPQCFKRDYLLKIYNEAKNDNLQGTDDSSLVERYGGKIKIILGDYENIKITTVEDIKIARSWKNEDRTGSI
ncbi:MAG: 2-C-methyl-D-erythritol 4-phosphate cytidylyltransferase [Fusobacteriaceae bacterium]